MNPSKCAQIFTSAALALPILLAACNSEPAAPAPSSPPLNSSLEAAQIKVQGEGRLLGGAEAGISAEQLRREIAELAQSAKSAAVENLVARYLDLAAQILEEAKGEDWRKLEIASIALAYDKIAGAHKGQSWTALVMARSADPSTGNDYENARARCLNELAAGRFNEAAAAMPKLGDGPGVLPAQAARLEGMALLAANQAQAACGDFLKALNAAQSNAYESATAALWLSEAQRRAGQKDLASQSWQRALAALAILHSKNALCPSLWERALYLRPIGEPLPAELQLQFAHELNLQAGEVQEARGLQLTWWVLARDHIERREAELALRDARKAAALASNDSEKDLLQILTARALIALGQMGPATGSLVQIADRSLGAPRAEALSILGTIELERDNIRRGLGLLKRALTEIQADWPQRGHAMADYGLGLILNGEDQQGRQWLASARQRFENDRDRRQLIRCLENEARYLRATDRESEASILEARVSELERA